MTAVEVTVVLRMVVIDVLVWMVEVKVDRWWR